MVRAALVIFALMGTSAFAQDGGTYNGPNAQPQPDRPARTKAKPAPSPADILRDAAMVAKAARLPCEVTQASLLNEGTATVNGKNVHVRTFETACSNGVGYFLVEQPPEPTMAFSCFSAEHTREVDKAQGREPGPACTLPTNADVKVMAGAILTKLGQSCQVTAVRSIGQETAKNTELTEAACTGGTGYVIATALPGSVNPPSAQSCPDAYKAGIACKLSSNGAPLLTMQTFKDALAQHNTPCAVEGMRLIGKETVKQRHVVEFKCPQQQPNGLVAFIPLDGNTAPFETADCAQSASRYKIICTLTIPR